MCDKALEQQRAEQVIRDLKPFALVGDCHAFEAWKDQKLEMISWSDALEAMRQPPPAGSSDEVAHPEDVMVYVYTGGTTKASKCVTVTHGMAMWEAENYGIVLGRGAGPGDKMLQPSTLYWGAAVFGQLSLGFSVGACVCIGGLPCGSNGAGDALGQMALDTARFQITVLGIVPSQLRGAWPDGPNSAPGSLRMLVTWADKTPVELARRWQTPRIRVVDLLIASEYWLTLHSDCKVWKDDDVEKHIYRTLPSLDIRLLVQDQSGTMRNAVPGEVGEMYLAGPTTSPGYVCPDGRVSLTFHDALATIDGKAYLRTRDQLLLLPDGGLVYAGRADSLMKHGGKWVDADALQDAVMAVPGVEQAAVIPGAQGVDTFVVLDRSLGLGRTAAAPTGETQASDAADTGATQPSKRTRVAAGGGPLRPFKVLAAVRRALPSGTSSRVHLVTTIARNAATHKVDGKALRACLARMEKHHHSYNEEQDRLTQKLIRYYKAWAMVAVGAVSGPTLLLAVLRIARLARGSPGGMWSSILTVLLGSCGSLIFRFLALPQLWAAATYMEDAKHARSLANFLRFKFLDLSRWSPLVLAAVLPTDFLCLPSLVALAVTYVVWMRERDVALAATVWSMFAAVCAPFANGYLGGIAVALAGASLLMATSQRRQALKEAALFVASSPALCWQVLPSTLGHDFAGLVGGAEQAEDTPRGLLGAIRRFRDDLSAPRWQSGVHFYDQVAVVDAGNKWSQVKVVGRDGDAAWSSIGIKVVLADELASPDSPLAPLLNQSGVARGKSTLGGLLLAGDTAGSGLPAALAVLVERVCGDSGADALVGLESIQAIQLAEAVRREFRRPLTVAEVLQCSDLTELLEVVKNAAELSPIAADSPTPQKSKSHFGEERPWRVWLCGMGPNTCSVDWMVTRQNSARHLDVAALQRAADKLVARHAALRARNHAEVAMFDSTYLAASLWQLWCAGSPSRNSWTHAVVGRIASGSIFAAWPRSKVLPATAPEARSLLLTPNIGDLRYCHSAKDKDQEAFWIGGALLQKHKGQMFHLCAVPVLSDIPNELKDEDDAIAFAMTRAPESVKWYIYANLDHGYCDGPTGAPLFADLLRLYGEEAGEVDAEHLNDNRPAEALDTLEQRLKRSLMPLPEAEHPNDDIFHDGLVGFGWRRGYTRFINFDHNLMQLLRVGAQQALGVSIDVAWLTVITGAFLRMFPNLERVNLFLIVTCRDGLGEEALVGYFSSRKLMPVEVGDARKLQILGLADMISTARRQRSWRRPRPFEKADAIEINMVSQAADGLPLDFQEVRCGKSPPRSWDRGCSAHMNLRLDQTSRDDWDFRLQAHDKSWGEDWSNYYAQALGSVLVDMAVCPTGPVVPAA